LSAKAFCVSYGLIIVRSVRCLIVNW